MKSTIIGFVLGVIITAIVGWSVMPNMMLKETQSPYSVEETVAKIKVNAEAKGWVVPSVSPLHQSIKKHSGGKRVIPPTMLVNLCNAEHAYKAIAQDDNKKISVFMPCTISVYEKNDGTTWIGYMNAKLLGDMFGGAVAETMTEVNADQQDFIKFVR